MSPPIPYSEQLKCVRREIAMRELEERAAANRLNFDCRTAASLLRSQAAEIAALRHDIERHVQIATERAEEIVLAIAGWNQAKERAERAESELAALKHDLAQYQARDAQRETALAEAQARIAELERDAVTREPTAAMFIAGTKALSEAEGSFARLVWYAMYDAAMEQK